MRLAPLYQQDRDRVVRCRGKRCLPSVVEVRLPTPKWDA